MAERWCTNTGSLEADEHTLGLISIEFQPIVSHPVISKVETGLK